MRYLSMLPNAICIYVCADGSPSVCERSASFVQLLTLCSQLQECMPLEHLCLHLLLMHHGIKAKSLSVPLVTGAGQGAVFRTAAEVATEEAQADEYIGISR